MGKAEEIVGRNIELSTEFSRYLFDHPELEDEIPLGAEIVLLPEFDPELRNLNWQLGKKLKDSGTEVVYIRIGKLRPKALSRIKEARMESIT